MASPQKKLRSNTELYILGHTDHQIVGFKLPSNRQVLSVFLYNLREVKLKQKESARLVIEEVFIFWEKARIPTSAKWYCVKKVEKMYENYKNLLKSHLKPTELHNQKEEEFISALDDLFDIAASNALTLMKIETDKLFLVSQRKKGREGCLIGLDKKKQRKRRKKAKRTRS